jgi:hypothetical protein
MCLVPTSTFFALPAMAGIDLWFHGGASVAA